jgi:hypothetical protein
VEQYIKSATAVFRIFTQPERYALENIREKTEATLIWTIGYLFLLATLTYLFEGANVSEAGKGGVVILYAISALTASVLLRWAWKDGDMTYWEACILYLTSLAIFLSAYVLAQFLTPYGHKPNAAVGVSAFAGAIYFFVSPAPKMLAALTGKGTVLGMRAFLSFFVISFVVWTAVVATLSNLVGDDVPLGHYLRQIP